MIVKELTIFPIKGLRGIKADILNAQKRGFEHDRRYMLVDGTGRFISQRNFPDLTQIDINLEENSFKVSNRGESISLPKHIMSDQKVEVEVWKDRFMATLAGHYYDEFFSDVLKKPLRLVYMGQGDNRMKAAKNIHKDIEVSFADGYPYLILGTQSVHTLNEKLDQSVPFNRFRANIILETNTAHEEDNLNTFNLGEATFQMVKPCARCQVINIDQSTGKSSLEPTKTLASYRLREKGIFFGMNAVILKEGMIKIGESVI